MTKYLLIMILCLTSHIFSAEEQKEEIKKTPSISLPTIEDITIGDFVTALAGSVDINGREWSLTKEDNQEILRQFLTAPHSHTTELRFLEEGFTNIPYDVDALGRLRMNVIFTNENFIDEEGYYVPYKTFLVTQLTQEELALPEVTEKQLSVSFEQHSEDYRSYNLVQKARYIENNNKIVSAMISCMINEEQRNLALQQYQQLMQQMATLPRACDIENDLS